MAAEVIAEHFHFNTNPFLVGSGGSEGAIDVDLLDLFSTLQEADFGEFTPESKSGSSGQPVFDGTQQLAPAPWNTSTGGDTLLPASTPEQFVASSSAQPTNLPSHQEWEALVQQHGTIAQQATQALSEDNSGNGKEDAERTRKRKNKQEEIKDLEQELSKFQLEAERLEKENEVLKFKKRVLQRLVTMRTHQLHLIQGFQGRQHLAPGADEDNSEVHDSASNSVLDSPWGHLHRKSQAQEQPPDRAKFETLSKQQFMSSYKNVLSDLSITMLELETAPDSEQLHMHIHRLSCEAMHLLKYTSIYNGDLMLQVLSTNMDTRECVEPPISLWQAALKSLKLSVVQQQDLLAVHHIFRRLMQGLNAERVAIKAKLASGEHAAYIREAALDQHIGAECEVMVSLMRNIRQEKSAHLMLRGFLFGFTLTVRQIVTLLTGCYPFFPDATAIIVCLASQFGQIG